MTDAELRDPVTAAQRRADEAAAAARKFLPNGPAQAQAYATLALAHEVRALRLQLARAGDGGLRVKA